MNTPNYNARTWLLLVCFFAAAVGLMVHGSIIYRLQRNVDVLNDVVTLDGELIRLLMRRIDRLEGLPIPPSAAGAEQRNP